MSSDGEIVWSWRAQCRRQVLQVLQRRLRGDGGKRWFTGETTYKS